MARLPNGTIGFESGSAQSEGLIQLAGTITYDAANGRPRTGDSANLGTCLSVTPNGTQQGVNTPTSTFANASDYYIRTNLYKTANPSASTIIISSYDGTVNPVQVRCTTAGALLVQDSLAATLFTSAALNSNQWYRIELRVKTATSTTGVIELWLDDVLLYSATNLNLGTGATYGFYWGNIGSATSAGSTFYFDDIAFNDTTGTDENGRPGDGKVYLLPPVSDPGTSSSNWTKPGSSTSNRHTSVDNVPPVYEVLDDTSGSAEDYVRHSTNGDANSALLLTLRDYATAGIIGKIKLVQPVCVTGSSSSLDTNGDIGISSNPTIAQASFTAFDNGTASATVTTWPRKTGTITYNPSGIAPATGPVIQIRKVTSTSRVVMVNFCGLIVEDTTFIPDVHMADRIT